MSRQTITTADPAPYQGEPLVLDLVVRDAAGAAVDITGWTLQWRLSAPNPSLDQESLVTANGALGTPADGEVSFTIPASATQRRAGAYVHEIRRVDAGSELTLFRGAFTVRNSAFFLG